MTENNSDINSIKKEDLLLVAEGICEVIPAKVTISDLKNLILNSDEYKKDSDFVTSVLITAVEDRKQREEVRKEEIDREEKERQRQYEMEEKERQRQYEMEEKERQRQYEMEEKERQRQYEMEEKERQRQYEMEEKERQRQYEMEEKERQRRFEMEEKERQRQYELELVRIQAQSNVVEIREPKEDNILSDVNDSSGSIDILIGADIMRKMLTGKTGMLKSGLVEVETHLGRT
ncbi:hypothetical protein TNCV_1884681 [Trichonephila clavipes]|nr:hypothetical protein TNCV_1884681 [Trichonephila clavipes]